jgi:hypothetical protein
LVQKQHSSEAEQTTVLYGRARLAVWPCFVTTALGRTKPVPSDTDPLVTPNDLPLSHLLKVPHLSTPHLGPSFSMNLWGRGGVGWGGSLSKLL